MKSILLALACVATLNAAAVSYTVAVDTSSIGSSASGYIEFQFNQANAETSLAATANVTDFMSTGYTFDDSSDSTIGGVSGSLSSPPLAFDNTVGATNLFDEGVTTFGSGFSFVVTFDGAALDTTATDGSGFLVYLYDTSYNVLAGGGDGTAASIAINGDTTVSTNPVAGLSTITPYTAPGSSTPEPSTVLLLGIGGGVLAIRRRAA